jgi:Flp pilus assembly secretin CpaC
MIRNAATVCVIPPNAYTIPPDFFNLPESIHSSQRGTHYADLRDVLCIFFILLQTLDTFEDVAYELAGTEGLEVEEHDDGAVEIHGHVLRLSDHTKLQRLKARHPSLKISVDVSPDIKILASPASRESVLLEMIFVEVKKTALKKLGVRLGGSVAVGSTFSFKFLPDKARDISLATVDPIRAFLDMALQKGDAKIHAKQSIVSQNGKAGSFQAGGEFPIRLITPHSSKVEYKPFGLFLKFTPVLRPASKIHLTIHSLISDIDLGSQVDGLPMIIKKELSTEVDANLDQMIALGGVVKASQSQFVDELPGLGSLPIIGRLFRSEDFKNQKSEAYLFVTAKKMESPWLPSPDL